MSVRGFLPIAAVGGLAYWLYTKNEKEPEATDDDDLDGSMFDDEYDDADEDE